jgi:hypothetical protein
MTDDDTKYNKVGMCNIIIIIMLIVIGVVSITTMLFNIVTMDKWDDENSNEIENNVIRMVNENRIKNGVEPVTVTSVPLVIIYEKEILTTEHMTEEDLLTEYPLLFTPSIKYIYVDAQFTYNGAYLVLNGVDGSFYTLHISAL